MLLKSYCTSYHSNFLEYSFPILIYLFQLDWVCDFKVVASVLFTLHFVKRLFENVFVHIHGAERKLALIDIIVNCTYYHGFAWWISNEVNSPFGCPQVDAGSIVSIIAWCVCEYGNLSCHMALREMKLNSVDRSTPQPSANYRLSRAFQLVSCPNYLFEVLSWVAFASLVNTLSAWLFAGLGLCVMAFWAREKHASYLEKFAEYPTRRKAIVPFIL